MRKDRLSDPTQEGADLIVETQTVTASSGNVTVTFNESYSSTPKVIATAKHSVETGVTIDSGSTFDSTECTLLAENDVDIDVLVIGLE